MTIEISNHQFTLLYEKALYKPDERLLVVADVHLGKANHFRKEGISIPAEAQYADYKNLETLFRKTDPLKVYFLGDLFHSSINRDWHYFTELIGKFPQISITLVQGNHDIIDHKLFKSLHISVTPSIEDDEFIYTHEPLKKQHPIKTNIAGHIHPGCVLSAGARQSLKLPCFYKTENMLILPAFGVLTGLYSMPRGEAQVIYVALPDKVMLVK
jgi:DNA ligase-associated metallophosphoesterase